MSDETTTAPEISEEMAKELASQWVSQAMDSGTVLDVPAEDNGTSWLFTTGKGGTAPINMVFEKPAVAVNKSTGIVGWNLTEEETDNG